jgi:hypothetical protein
MPSELEQLAYDLSSRALAQQESFLNDLRSHTGTVLAASALVASFLGAKAIDGNGIGWAGGSALAMFVASVVFSLYVLLPRTGLRFSVRGSTVLDQFDRSIGDAYRRVTHRLERAWSENARLVGRLIFVYRIAVGSTLAEVILWSVELAR